MKNKFVKTWDHCDSPLIWVETIYIADTKIMQKLFKFKYDGHYFLNNNQVVSFYKNIETENRAKKFGYTKFNRIDFLKFFIKESKICEKNLKKFDKYFVPNYLKQKPNQELANIFSNYFYTYSELLAFYHLCRQDFYEEILNKIKNKLKEPKEGNLIKILSGQHNDISNDKNIIKLAKYFKIIGERRLNMHKTWMESFKKADILFIEIDKRLKLNSLEIKNCTSREIINLLNNKININKKIIQKRIKGYKFIYRNKDFEIKIVNAKKVKQNYQKIIKGQIACKGIVKGKVFKISETLKGINQNAFKKMKKGDILVTEMTSPDMIAGIKKAAGIIIDDGGLLCHAAIISREFNIPCIIGTKIATKVLKDGDRIEVNAEKGIIKKLK